MKVSAAALTLCGSVLVQSDAGDKFGCRAAPVAKLLHKRGELLL